MPLNGTVTLRSVRNLFAYVFQGMRRDDDGGRSCAGHLMQMTALVGTGINLVLGF